MHFVWCKVHLPFIVSRILQSRRKNAHFKENRPFQPLLGVFQALRTWSLRRIIALTGTDFRASFPAFSAFAPQAPLAAVPCQSSIDRTTSRGWLGLPSTPYSLLATPCLQGMGGMHTVWTRYGKGMSPSLKPFKIKYGGMAYRALVLKDQQQRAVILTALTR